MDRNSLTGAILIVLIWIVFSTFFLDNKEIHNTNEDNKNTYVKTELDNTNDVIIQTSQEDSTKTVNQNNIFSHLENKEDGFEIIENNKMRVVINKKGGAISSVILKDFKTYNGTPLDLFSEEQSVFNLQFFSQDTINTSELYFEPYLKGNSLSMTIKLDDQHYIEYVYTISDNYLIDFSINTKGINEIIRSTDYMNLEWGMITPKTEKSKSNQDMYTGIYYQDNADKEVDNLNLSKKDEELIKFKLNWIAFKQQFFSSILIAENGFEKPILLKSNPNSNEDVIKNLYAKFEIPLKNINEEKINFQFYFGPNHYKTLQNYNLQFEELIPLGWGIFGWVNKYIIIPIFDFLSKFGFNYGIIILLLTIIIKLALSPFTYKAFLSQAKMKVLKPEIDKINEKNKGKDPMKVQQATMNFYRKAGVSPMGGCLPMLFQFPILIAMFRFFPASIELRQQSFLWADDLSAYDSIYDLGFSIPFYGDHVSLFTLLMTVSTLLYTRMNSSMATGQMAQMKWMMYLMPIMFLGFFNNYAAGLSYYYFLANMFTFGQQAIMKNSINEEKLLAQIEENKKKPKKKSKFQRKLEEIQRQQEQKIRNKKK